MKTANYVVIALVIMAILVYGCKTSEKDIVEGAAAENETISENSSDDINKLIVKEDNETAESNSSNEDNLTTDTLVMEEDEENPGDLIVHFIDVGHGDSIFVQTPNNGTMLIDGGFDDKGSVVIGYLRSQGISSFLDVMVATHPDRENVGGLDSVLFNLASVAESYDNGYGANSQSYQAFVEFSKAKGMFNVVTQDTEINLDGNKTKIQVIVPYVDGYLNSSDDNSLVIKITYGDISYLLTGDCGFECEKKIMGHDIRADVLKVAHNGANSSTSQEFLDEVKPRLAIISTGAHNEYGYPHAEVLQRLMDNNIEVLRTDYNGTIVVKTDGEGLTVRVSK